MKAIGLISGTSVDGIDAVIVDISDTVSKNEHIHIDVLGFATYPYPAGVRERILEVSTPGKGTVGTICHLNAYIGELFARAAIQITHDIGISLDEIAVIGSHGQTIHHLPNSKDEEGIKITSTLQIGEAAIIAERTGVTTVADFRPRDMAAGGQGAPFAPYTHYLLFRHPIKDRIITNIGGISNLTYVPAGALPEQVIAFDSGPGNMVIDQVISRLTNGFKTYDESGRWAAQGTCHQELLAWLMSHPYLERNPPKSTGREEFGEAFIERVFEQRRKFGIPDNDLLATVTEFTAEAIVRSFHTFLPAFRENLQNKREEPTVPEDKLELMVCGGGVKNHTLMTLLQKQVEPLPIFAVEHYHISSEALEAITFALLARETILGKPSNLPGVTGATHPVVLGKIIPGIRFKGVIQEGFGLGVRKL